MNRLTAQNLSRDELIALARMFRKFNSGRALSERKKEDWSVIFINKRFEWVTDDELKVYMRNTRLTSIFPFSEIKEEVEFRIGMGSWKKLTSYSF